MNFISVVDGLSMTFCGVILIASVIPLCMMPYRMIQAFRDKVKRDVECGKSTYNHVFAWLAYGFVGGGIVFSLFNLGLVKRELAVSVTCFVGCIWMALLLVCCVAAGIYKRIVKRRGI